MKQIDEHRFLADEQKTFVHKSSSKRMGNGIYLANGDSIENYTEEPMTPAEISAYEESKRKRESAKENRQKSAKKTVNEEQK